MTRTTAPVGVILFLLLVVTPSANAQATDFTYQGQLQNGAAPANGNFDFEFLLFDAVTGGAQLGTTLARNNVAVANGVFAVSLNFGNQFPSAARFLEIRVKPSGAGALTPLTPRQPFTSSPYAIRSSSAGSSDLSLTALNFLGNLSGDVAGTQSATVVNSVGGQTAANVANAAVLAITATSANTPNTLAKRDGSGDLTASRLNATFQFNLSGNRILAAPGGENLYVGPSTGTANVSGTGNAFVGTDAGRDNTASRNSFFGSSAGTANSSGSDNAFFGYHAGTANTSGFNNTFFGSLAGANGNGSGNTSIGYGAGVQVSSGGGNTSVGHGAGSLNQTGSNNTLIGTAANVGSGALSFATAIGANALVTTSNTIMLGSDLDTVIAPNLLRVNFLGSAGATPLCRNANNTIATCSSSLRYKTNFAPFRAGLSFVKQLRPISFDWKDGGMHDVGFGAEDVARIDPLFVTYNTAGEVEGVKYDRISVVLVNAVSEQQTQIEAQRSEIERQRKLIIRQQSDIDALKAHICGQTPAAALCVPAN